MHASVHIYNKKEREKEQNIRKEKEWTKQQQQLQ